VVKVSGTGRIVEGPFFYSDSGKGYGADLVIEFAKDRRIQAVSPNWLMTQSLYPLHNGQTVHFEGQLHSEEDGMYLVKLSLIRKFKRG